MLQMCRFSIRGPAGQNVSANNFRTRSTVGIGTYLLLKQVGLGDS